MSRVLLAAVLVGNQQRKMAAVGEFGIPIPEHLLLRPEWNTTATPASALVAPGINLPAAEVAELEMPAMVAERALATQAGVPLPNGWIYQSMVQHGPRGIGDVPRFTKEWYSDTSVLKRMRDAYFADKTLSTKLNTYTTEQPGNRLFDRPVEHASNPGKQPRIPIAVLRALAPNLGLYGVDSMDDVQTKRMYFEDGSPPRTLMGVSDQFRPTNPEKTEYIPFEPSKVPRGTTLPATLSGHELVHFYQILLGKLNDRFPGFPGTHEKAHAAPGKP